MAKLETSMVSDRYYFDDGKSRKFWSIVIRAKSVVTTWGRLGAKGRESTKVYNSSQEAQAAAKTEADDKVQRGYIRIDPAQLKINRLDGVRGATEKQVAKFEQQIGTRLPDEYRNFLLTYNGGRPVSEGINVFGHPSPYGYIGSIDPIYSLNPNVPSYESLQDCIDPKRVVLPPGHLPIADSGGNLITIDLKRKIGVIYYFDHEIVDYDDVCYDNDCNDVSRYKMKHAILLAGSFDELLTRMAVHREPD